MTADLTLLAGIMGLFVCICVIVVGVGMDADDD